MQRQFLSSLLLSALCAGSAYAVDQPKTTHLETAEGQQMVVHSGQPDVPANGPHPAFSVLDRNKDGMISPEEAKAYPPLANDFIYVDLNRDGGISNAEYTQWH